ncbi:MAG: hypothetical protein R2726_13365 [Acidimicrobiales bacterium]
MGLLDGRRAESGTLQRHDLALVVDHVAGEEPGHDLEGVLEQVEARTERRERDPELVVLLVEPRGAERQDEPAVRRVVDGDRLRRQHRRVAVGHPGDEEAEPDPRGDAGQRGERRHALEGLTGSLAVHRLEVVEAPRALEAELLGQLDTADELVPGHPLLGDVQSEAHVVSSALVPGGDQPVVSRLVESSTV